MTFSITCNQLHDHTDCTLTAHFAHMHVLTCAGTRTCAISSLQAAVLIHCSLLICIMQENNFACFYMFSLFGQPLNNVSTSRNFNPAADCWAVRRPLPADYGRPWCIRLAHISAIACTASVKDCCNWDHTAYTVKEMFGPRTPLTWQVQCEWVNTAKGTQGCDRLCTHHKAGCWHKSLYILIVQGSTVSLVVGHFMFVLQSDVPCAEDTSPHCPKVWMSITVLYLASMVVIEVGPRPRQTCLTCRIDTGRV